MTHRLPDDYAHCRGNLFVASLPGSGAMYIPCPSRDQCLRYLSRMSAGEYATWMMAPPDASGRCCKYMVTVPSAVKGEAND